MSQSMHDFALLGFIFQTFLGLVNAQAAASSDAPTVHLKNGSYYGVHSPEWNQDFFYGMPYAQPPVGQLRFANPVGLNETWSGLRNATEYGYSCVGYGEDTEMAANNYTNEDCLSLTVVRPSGEFEKPLPVAVWIYGGGFFAGSSAGSWYNMTFLVDRSVEIDQPIMVVSMNYRLAFWGWLYNEDWAREEGNTNIGMRDQRLAMHWVQENIAAFGGDPKRVTIFGESAGAYAVSNQVFAYNGRDDGLFAGAISQSGPPAGLGLAPTHETISLATTNVTETVCPDAEDKLACLRQADFEDLNNAINATLSIPAPRILYGPVSDGDIIARSQIEQIKDGDFVKVPYILGNTHDEGGVFATPGLNSDDDLHATLTGPTLGLNFSQAVDIMAIYPLWGPEQAIPEVRFDQLNETIGLQWKRQATIYGDARFGAGSYWSSEEWAKHNASKMYRYIANVPIAVGPRWLGAAHGFDFAYTLNNVNGTGWEGDYLPFEGGNPFEGRSQSYRDLAAVMSGVWIGFMNTGVPSYRNQPVPEWSPYTTERPDVYMVEA